MRKDQRLITMEVVDDILIIRKGQILQSFYAVIVITAEKYADGRRYLPNSFYTFSGNPVPDIAIRFIGHFIKEFEGQKIFVLTESDSELFP